MIKPASQPIYDPAKTYDENFDAGPFGEFASQETYQNKGEPRHKFLGFPVHEPFGIPAGPLLNAEYMKAAMRKGFDIVTYKTQRSVKFGCNDFPNVLYVDTDGDLTLEKASNPQTGKKQPPEDMDRMTITNSFGNPSRGPEFWVDDLRRAVETEGEGQMTIMSVVGTIQESFSPQDYYQDFADTAKMAADTGVKAIEVNLSCPNVASEGVLCYTPEAVEEITRLTKDAIGDTPLIAKVGYYSQGQDELLQQVLKLINPYVDAVASINTIPAPVVDEGGNQALPGPNRLKSGMCGAGIRWAGLDMVKRLTKHREALGLDYEILGVGGVMTPADYFELRVAGATAVQSATGSMWNPRLAIEIKESIS